MSDTIKPALSDEEWRDVDRDTQTGGREHFRQEWCWVASGAGNWPAVIALANAALPDSDPRKITRETIAALDWVLAQAGQTGDYVSSVEDKLRPIRDALESYLPREGA